MPPPWAVAGRTPRRRVLQRPWRASGQPAGEGREGEGAELIWKGVTAGVLRGGGNVNQRRPMAGGEKERRRRDYQLDDQGAHDAGVLSAPLRPPQHPLASATPLCPRRPLSLCTCKHLRTATPRAAVFHCCGLQERGPSHLLVGPA